MRPVLLAVLTSFAVTGCSSVPIAKTFAVKTADFKTASDLNLCTVYGYGRDRAREAKEELVQRNVFTIEEWHDIEEGRIRPGMSLCAVYAAYTNSCVKYDATKEGIFEEMKQITYDCTMSNVLFCPYTQITLRNDKVIEIRQLQSP